MQDNDLTRFQPSTGTYDRLTMAEMKFGLELAGIGVITVDYVTDCVVLDTIAATAFGLEAECGYSRKDFHARVHPADWPAVSAEVDKLFDPSCSDTIDIRHRTLAKDGSTRWVHARKTLYRESIKGLATIKHAVATVRDITAEVEAMQMRDLLIQEMNHRTKNIFAIVNSIALLTKQSSSPEKFADDFIPRLNSILSSQSLEFEEQSPSLKKTITAIIEPFTQAADGRFVLQIEDISISARASQTIALVVHELATNAVKYGSLARVGGLVHLTTRVDGDHWQLDWVESGGAPVKQPGRKGFGTKILQRYGQMSLKAAINLEYHQSGVQYSMRAPLAAVLAT